MYSSVGKNVNRIIQETNPAFPLQHWPKMLSQYSCFQRHLRYCNNEVDTIYYVTPKEFTMANNPNDK